MYCTVFGDMHARYDAAAIAPSPLRQALVLVPVSISHNCGNSNNTFLIFLTRLGIIIPPSGLGNERNEAGPSISRQIKHARSADA